MPVTPIEMFKDLKGGLETGGIFLKTSEKLNLVNQYDKLNN